jgi:hypothetical protein
LKESSAYRQKPIDDVNGEKKRILAHFKLVCDTDDPVHQDRPHPRVDRHALHIIRTQSDHLQEKNHKILITNKGKKIGSLLDRLHADGGKCKYAQRMPQPGTHCRGLPRKYL